MSGLQRLWRSASARLATLRVRLTLWYVVLLAAILAGYSAILIVTMSRGLEAGLDHLLGDGVRQAVGVLSATPDEQELRVQFRHLNAGNIVGLYDVSGQQLIVGRGLPPPFDGPVAPAGSEPRIDTLTNTDGASWRVLVQRVSVPGQPERLLLVARSAGFIDVAVGELAMLIAVTGPLTLLLAIAGGTFLAGRALDPINQITRTAEVISAKDLSRRLALRRAHDEVGRLAVTFDDMLDRLDHAFERQRQFIADASHELQTPLAMVVSRAGLALERRRTIEEYETVLQAIRDEGLHMGRIVNDLLMLARADAGDALAVSERLDAAELVRSVVDGMRALADDRGVQLLARGDTDIAVIGDQTRLTQLLVNLADNALAHTPAGGEVVVSASRDETAAVLQVRDTGTGIAARHLPHVFERFYRADRDRPRDRIGAGLGLSLCQSITRAHGGDITIESEVGKGTLVTVRLPLAPDAASQRVPASAAAD